jgi:NTE family protein
MRAATVSTSRDLTAAREATDVLVTPDVSKVEIRDFGAYEPAVAEGYRATLEALDKLDRPVQALRRRPSLAERQAQKPQGAAAR